MKRLLFIILFINNIAIVSYAQMINWQQCYGGYDFNFASDIIAESNGNYVVVGLSNATDGLVDCDYQGYKTWLIEIDSIGRLLNQKCYIQFFPYNIHKDIKDGNYFLIGETSLGNSDEALHNLGIKKVDENFEVLWERSYGSLSCPNYSGHKGRITSDGGVIACTGIQCGDGDPSEYFGMWDVWIIKTDSLGNIEWDKTLGTKYGVEGAVQIIPTTDSAYLMLSTAKVLPVEDYGEGNIDCFIDGNINTGYAVITKLDLQGRILWNRCYGGPDGDDGLYDMVNVDRGYVFVGLSSSIRGDLSGVPLHYYDENEWEREADKWIMKTDLDGNIIWQKRYGGYRRDGAHKIISTSDGGFMIFGYTQSKYGDITVNPSSPIESIWITRLDKQGNLLWQRTISNSFEGVNGACQVSGNKYTLCGVMSGAPGGDIFCTNYIYGVMRSYYVCNITDTVSYISTNDYSKSQNLISIYPNPISDKFTFSGSPDNVYDIIMQNINGQTVKVIKQVMNGDVINVGDLPTGLYMIMVNDEKEKYYAKIMIL